jgi:hypothetical protein
MSRDHFVSMYLDYRNNYITVARWAEAYGLTEQEGTELLTVLRAIFNGQHPDA